VGAFSLQTWIFQGNPEYFDIDGYFATNPARFVWRVTRYADTMRPGDRVFIYRTGPAARTAGVVAEAEIIGAPAPQPDTPDAVPFYRGDRAGAMEVRPRVPLSLLRVAGNREVLRRDWLREDPVLRDLPNLQPPPGTNYLIEAAQAARLMALWDRTGRDWTRNERGRPLGLRSNIWATSVSPTGLPGSRNSVGPGPRR
jgi:EVE domain